jgi:lysophospholipase L1-like esterase
MPLGASITHGVGTDSGNGYRQYLLEHLNGDGFEVDYVGSQSSGTMEDKDNEGYPGKRIEEITTTIGGTLPNLPGPNVYTINAGTNDAIQDFDVNNAGVRMYDMLDYLWSVTPDATVVLSTLIRHLNPDTDARVGNINEQFRGLVWDLANQQGKRIVLAEMHGDDGPQEGDINDDEIHPNEEGFKKMATVWHRSILEANDAGLILPAP